MNYQDDIISMPFDAGAASVAVLADGTFPERREVYERLMSAGRIVCCDGAVESLVGHGGTPYAIVGDCDSLPDRYRETYRDIIFCDKDQETNDLTKAVRFCISRGFKSIDIYGATGKREDHTVGNISLLADYGELCDRVRILTELGVFDPVYGRTILRSPLSRQVSVFTFSPETTVTTIDLRYPLERARLTRWWQGTLNETTKDTFGFDVNGPAVIYRLF